MGERVSGSASSLPQVGTSTLTFWACSIAGIQFVIDTTLMALIAPSAARALGMSQGTTSLVTSLFPVMLAACILAGGSLGDIYGRKRLLGIGVVIEGVTALLSIVAPNAVSLMLLRALAGIGAALISPLTIAIIQSTFTGEARAQAMSRYVGMLGLSVGIGTIVVQSVNQFVGWRATFGLVVLLGIVAFILLQGVPESARVVGRRIDWVGIVLAGIGLVALVYGMNQASRTGGFLDIEVLGPVGIGIVALALLVIYDSRHPEPALQVSLFRKPLVVVGALIAIITFFAQSAVFYQFNIYLQVLLQLSPLMAAFYIIPLSLTSFVVSLYISKLVHKIALPVLTSMALLLVAAGIMGLAVTMSTTANFWLILVPLMLVGSGVIIINTQRIALIVGSAPQELAGSASALSNSLTNLGTALGIAVSSALFSVFTRSAYVQNLTNLGATQQQIEKSGQALRAVIKANNPSVGAQYGLTVSQTQIMIKQFSDAYVQGLATVYWLIAAVLVVMAVFVFLLLRRVQKKIKRA